jgi:hypothetical protein
MASPLFAEAPPRQNAEHFAQPRRSSPGVAALAEQSGLFFAVSFFLNLFPHCHSTKLFDLIVLQRETMTHCGI